MRRDQFIMEKVIHLRPTAFKSVSGDDWRLYVTMGTTEN